MLIQDEKEIYRQMGTSEESYFLEFEAEHFPAGVVYWPCILPWLDPVFYAKAK